MRWQLAGILWMLAAVCFAADSPTVTTAPSAAPPATALPLCSNSGSAPRCHGPSKDLKAARQAFSRGLKLEKSQND
ncbi:MAG: hypothetical protein WBD45_11850, partial [Terriglobales bacterium]